MAEEQTNYTQGYSEATVSSHASRTIETDAAFLRQHIKPTDHILDVGCGPGTITVGFGHLVRQGSVTGIDISDFILRQAREAVDKIGSGESARLPIDFVQADLLAGLPFPDAKFDVVFSSQLFPHLATAETRLRALTEMRRVLKPGGILATRDAAELHFYPRSYGLDRLWTGNMARTLRRGESDQSFPGGGMPALYRQAGFGSASSKLEVGAGTTVFSGGEARRWYAARNLGRLQPQDPYRASWLQAGVSEGEITETIEALQRWAEDEDAWYVALQAEVLGWKDV
ncbi:S-adenosyl-L-methionine-dependent methyltransferase [Thozetella sp. PMI_491]|nr:S-adenosyl-L-methionine-dependent methyltransferase [Thozetella sp. PMI_491]